MISTPAISAAYDKYFQSGLYESRYPRPNPSMVRVLESVLPDSGSVLDFGCGNGRYLPFMLAHRALTVTGYDISAEAGVSCRQKFAAEIAAGHLRLVIGGLDDLAGQVGAGTQDAVLLMFGVLGHIRGRADRVATLPALRRLLRPGGRVVVTVPNRRRRFQAEQAACAGFVAQGELEAGDILYKREADGTTVELFYHLYSLEEFLGELSAAGFVRPRPFAESVLPERMSINGGIRGLTDSALRLVCPLPLAYGFGAVAERGTDG